ncbi:hypothetical protein [Aquella oligotrophica]|uniref:Uncharacterized protein n=1 Tax=Aquella oligotrophica TaxID=2067065 RepID=A0A2I7N5E7_9NEIS|nr:hypothetical protein [Aquella oligotrophica]AUR51679.1 hypothetical protein CUN60_05020 [Aquella oligotrophica]
MIKLKKYFVLILGLIIPFYSWALLNNLFSSDSESGNGILQRRVHQERVSSETKAAAKTAACVTVGRVVCPEIKGAVYLKNQLLESASKTKESELKHESNEIQNK